MFDKMFVLTSETSSYGNFELYYLYCLCGKYFKQHITSSLN